MAAFLYQNVPSPSFSTHPAYMSMFLTHVDLTAGFGSTECVMPTDDYDGTNSRKLSGFALVKIQFFALLVKRFHYMRRSKKSFIAQVTHPSYQCPALGLALL